MIALNENRQKSGTGFAYAFADSDVSAEGSTVPNGNGYARRRVKPSPVQDCCALGPGPGCYPDEITLEEYLGAVFKWGLCWDRFSWSMVFWPADHSGEPPQRSAVRALSIWAGFMSEARGEHWDRKSRYGIK
jgi:hypothetical protein